MSKIFKQDRTAPVALTVGAVGNATNVAVVTTDFPGIGEVGYIVMETNGIYSWFQCSLPMDNDPIIATIKKHVYARMKNQDGSVKK